MNVERQFTGKYEESGRIGTWLVDRFYRAVAELGSLALGESASTAPARALDMGCGAGFSTERLQRSLGGRIDLEACDVEISLAEKAKRRNPGTDVTVRSVYDPGFSDKSFELTFLLEVLEHLEQPQEALEQMRRITRSWLILSTPREPIWRALNIARGKYLLNLGNTPGHIQHWSSAQLGKEVSKHFEVVSRRTPLPWTILLLRPR